MDEFDTNLDFKPITEGLGFHPFSDGLPYAPVSKSRSQGAGATVAGPVRIARSISTVTTAPVVARAPMAPAVAAPAPTQTFESRLGEIAERRFGFAYLAKRTLAYLFDSALNIGVCGLGLAASLWNQNLNPELLLNPGIVLVATLFVLVFNWALITAQEVAFCTSIGKRIFGLALEGSTAAIFLRAFFFLPSAGFCGLGLLWSLVDSRRRCWHDIVVDLQPIEIARL